MMNNFEDFNWEGCEFPEAYLRSIFTFAKHHQFRGVCLEIGFDSGSSALAILRACPEAVVLSVDIQECPRGKALIEKHGMNDRVTFVQADSRTYLKSLQGPFNYIYIDGDHDYDAVIQDLRNSEKLLSQNGIMVVDDCDPDHIHFGVAKAVKEFIAETGFIKSDLIGSPSRAVILTRP